MRFANPATGVPRQSIRRRSAHPAEALNLTLRDEFCRSRRSRMAESTVSCLNSAIAPPAGSVSFHTPGTRLGCSVRSPALAPSVSRNSSARLSAENVGKPERGSSVTNFLH